MANKRRIVTLPSLTSVTAGSTATLLLPVGLRKYHEVILVYKDGTGNQAAIEAALKNVSIKINGRPQREHTVAELNVINAHKGRAFQTGCVKIIFSEANIRTMTGEELLGWGTANVQTFAIEIAIDAAAVAPAITAMAVVEDSSENLGVIVKTKRFTGYQTAAAGTINIRDLPRNPDEAYARFHIMTANATSVSLKADSDIIVEDIPRATLAALYASRPQETIMQPNTLTLDLMASTQISDILPMLRPDGRLVQDFPLGVTLNGATVFNVLTEVIGPAN